MKSGAQRFRNLVQPSRSLRHPVFEDKVVKHGDIRFNHSWANLKHMHDLRAWVIAYAPAQKGDMRKLQELHYINQEMWYQISEAMWRRILLLTVSFFFFTRINPKRYMKKYNNDSHDAHMRDTATLL